MNTVLVANRGEIAVRIIRAVHAAGGRAVAIHPADDADALHVRLADEALLIPGAGPAAYLDAEAIVAAARSARSSAIHPGYGFLSESAAFARRCAGAGITFIGPAPEVLDLFGDKARARKYARTRGIPVLPGTTAATTLAEAAAFTAEHGGVMIKALAGGGGRGLRAVTRLDALPEAFAGAAAEAETAFGRGEVYVEKLLERPQHVEVQILGDAAGAVVALGERDCSIQRRHQKLVEVTPGPWLSGSLRGRLTAAAVRLAQDAGYAGLGTFEFLVYGEQFWFMEANPRIQVEHTVTEEVTGTDLVAAQLAVAGGAALADLGLRDAPEPRGVAIQLRVNAEALGPDGAPIPSAGELIRFDLPTGPGVRVDTYGYPGYHVSARYDPLLAKIIVHGPDLARAAARARAALEETVIAGVATNADLLHGIVSSGAFLARPWDTGFIAEHLAELRAHRRSTRGPGAFAGAHDAQRPGGRTGRRLPAGAVAIRAPGPGVVVRLEAAAGDIVGAGHPVMVIEAMKMEHVIRAPAGLRLDVLTVAAGDVVESGTMLGYGTPADLPGHHGSPGETAGSGDWSAEVTEIERRRDLALLMGGPLKVARQHGEGKLDARQRVEALADPGSFAEIGALAGFASNGGTGGEARFRSG